MWACVCIYVSAYSYIDGYMFEDPEPFTCMALVSCDLDIVFRLCMLDVKVSYSVHKLRGDFGGHKSFLMKSLILQRVERQGKPHY